MSLIFVYENMARMFQRSRQLLATSTLVLLAVVVVLSAATRRPCLHVHTGPWHTFKAGHMAAPELHKSCKLQVWAKAKLPGQIPAVQPLVVSIGLPHVEALLPALSIVDQIDRFRSPPPLT
jgi:hypothetical protein